MIGIKTFKIKVSHLKYSSTGFSKAKSYMLSEHCSQNPRPPESERPLNIELRPLHRHFKGFFESVSPSSTSPPTHLVNIIPLLLEFSLSNPKNYKKRSFFETSTSSADFFSLIFFCFDVNLHRQRCFATPNSRRFFWNRIFQNWHHKRFLFKYEIASQILSTKEQRENILNCPIAHTIQTLWWKLI